MHSFQTIGDFDVEVSRVMEISKRITKHKLSNLDHKEGADVDVDEDFQQILIAYHGENMFWLLTTISV